MKIVQLTAQNIKRLKAVSITPEGNTVVISGRNGQGKSSVLDAIAMALGGKALCPDMPIRHGQKGAKVSVQLDGDRPMLVTRTFASDGGSTLTVTSADGKMKYASPQKLLDDLTGKLMFDPLAFTRMRPLEQLALLKDLVGLDLSDLDERRGALYGERTIAGRDVAGRQSQLDAMPDYPEAPAVEVSVADLAGELEAANAQNRERQDAEDEALVLCRQIADREMKIDKGRAEIAEEEKTIVVLRDRAKEADDAVAAIEVIDTDPIRQRINDADETNRKVRENAAKAAAQANFDRAKEAYADLTDQIEGIDQERASLLAAAKFPVAGLGFTADGVTLNGLPFAQVSSSEQLKVSVAICLASHPALGHVPIYDGSLLDAESLNQLKAMVKDANALMWIERVEDGAPCSVVIEDGSVVQGDET